MLKPDARKYENEILREQIFENSHQSNAEFRWEINSVAWTDMRFEYSSQFHFQALKSDTVVPVRRAKVLTSCHH